MPSQRKRIGFLPGIEVQDIINKISKKENFSQSKVTGLLVEEALKARGLFNDEINNINNDNIGYFLDNQVMNFINDYKNNKKNLLSTQQNYDSKKNIDKNQQINNPSLEDEYEILKQYLEYKKFKKILDRAKKENLI